MVRTMGAAAFLALAACATAAPRGTAVIAQVLTGFNNPESCAFSPDGKWLFVTNCASGEFGADKHLGMVVGEGSISKLSVEADGKLAVVNAKFVEGLNSPLGIAAAPDAFGPYPKGSLFVCVGNALSTDGQGNAVKDAKALGTGIAVFDPESGKALGKIDLGIGSAVAIAQGHPSLLLNGIAFDGTGGLYVSDTGAGGDRLEPKMTPHPGILRLTLGPKGEVTGHGFIPASGGPNGVGWSEKEKVLYWVTCSGQGTEGGAVFRKGKLFVPDLGPSDGIVFTPSGTVVVSRFQGDLVAIVKGGTPSPIRFDRKFNFPSDLKLRTLSDGSSIVVVPEQEAWNPAPWGQSVRVVRLPAGY